MRKLAALTLGAALLLGLSHAAVATTHAVGKRQHEQYSGQNGFTLLTGVMPCNSSDVATAQGPGLGYAEPTSVPEVTFIPQSFRTVSFTIEDQSGTAVLGVAYQAHRELGSFCGSTRRAFRLHGSKPVTVDLFNAVTSRGPSVVLGGTVTAAFGN